MTVATQLDEAKALLLAERDENVCRKDMTPSEKVSLGVALEALERPRAEARRLEGNARGGGAEVEGKFPSTSPGMVCLEIQVEHLRARLRDAGLDT